MKRFWLGIAATVAVSACGGTAPWGGNTTDPDEPENTIPEAVQGDLEKFSYDPTTQTLIVSGISLDDTPFSAVYRRRPGLDVPGYEAYTSQESSLGRHTTAFVRERDGVTGGVMVSGGQFGRYFGGAAYGRQGAFDRPDTTQAGGLVSYAGTYVGLLNTRGDGGDLLPVDPSTPIDVRPGQAAEVTGDILITADFVDNSVEGRVYNRVVPDSSTALDNIDLEAGAIDSNGYFTGAVVQGPITRGDYGGVFGGTDSSAVAGGLFATDHVAGASDIEEYGIFVLGSCNSPSPDPVCNQPVP